MCIISNLDKLCKNCKNIIFSASYETSFIKTEALAILFQNERRKMFKILFPIHHFRCGGNGHEM